MKSERPEYLPVKGKTYSLFGESGSTIEYYETIRSLADEILRIYPDAGDVVKSIAGLSSGKRTLKKLSNHPVPGNMMSDILNLIDPFLKKYTEDTDAHIKSLPFRKCWDTKLATSREQYHLYMIEIELNNRINSIGFKMADRKIALMPYCLQDFTVSCRSAKKNFDYQCNHCSAGCFQNHASEILRNSDVEPYIWMGGDIKKLGKEQANKNRSLGVLGIACIPELTWGIRTCRKNNIPALGLPLNANRCIRWFGEFFLNNVDLDELVKLLK